MEIFECPNCSEILGLCKDCKELIPTECMTAIGVCVECKLPELHEEIDDLRDEWVADQNVEDVERIAALLYLFPTVNRALWSATVVGWLYWDHCSRCRSEVRVKEGTCCDCPGELIDGLAAAVERLEDEVFGG